MELFFRSIVTLNCSRFSLFSTPRKFRVRFHAKTCHVSLEATRRARGESGPGGMEVFRSSRGDRRQKRKNRERERERERESEKEREGAKKASLGVPRYGFFSTREEEKRREVETAADSTDSERTRLQHGRYFEVPTFCRWSLSLSLSPSGLTLFQLTLASSVSSRRISLALPLRVQSRPYSFSAVVRTRFSRSSP